MKKHAVHSILLLACTWLTACIEPYQPKLSEDYPDLLVIDGAIDASHNKATVIISHSMALDNNQGPARELAAQVTLEEQAGSTVSLPEVGAGRYEADGLSIDHLKQYRLTIKTRGGKSYQSAYVQVMQTPPIDSISWKPTADGITIHANTHGSPDLNSRGYYQWSFTETWEYNSRYYSSVIFDDGVVSPRPSDLNIYYCWKTVPSTVITVGSSKKLSSDVMREFPVVAVPKASYQLSRTYSILVQQRSLTEEGYAYWQQLQKTTQNVGGLFDPLPAQVTGNFTCLTDPEETVLGFFSGSTVDEKRIFIRVRDLPRELQMAAPYPACSVDSLPNDVIRTYHGQLYLIGPYGMGPGAAGYLVTSRGCVDCTALGGVTKKPDFWE
jgi:hypothetical protein